MPAENFSRRVARAASIGGGRTFRRETPAGWYAILLIVCVLGVALIAYSRYQVDHPATASTSQKSVPPTASDMWEVGLDLDICGKVTQLPMSTAAGAYTTNGKGVVTIEPQLATDPTTAGGKNAILNAVLIPAGVSLTNKSLALTEIAPSPATTTTTTTAGTTTTSTDPSATSTSNPNGTTTTSNPNGTTTTSTPKGTTSTSTTTSTVVRPPIKTYSNGARCEGQKGYVETDVWSSPKAKHATKVSNAAEKRLKNGELITIAFLPKGVTVPKPTSASAISEFLLSNPEGVAPSTTTTTLPTTTTIPTTSTGASSTSTGESGISATSTTTAGGTTTTSTTKGSANQG